MCVPSKRVRQSSLRAGLVLCLAGLACSDRTSSSSDPSKRNTDKAPPAGEQVAAGSNHEPEREPPAAAPLVDPVLVMRQGDDGELVESWLSARDAQDAGYTVVDFGVDWTPFIFETQRGPQGQPLPNRYRRVYLGLANDQLDSDGRQLEEGEENYLELYGIAPSVAVIQRRFLRDVEQPCITPEAQAILRAVESVPYATAWKTRNVAKKQEKLGEKLAREMKRSKVEDFEALKAKKPNLAKDIDSHTRWLARTAAMKAAEERLVCEGFLDPEATGRRKHQPGVYDEPMRVALRGFQQKHMIYEGHTLRPRTLEHLANTTLENDQESFERVFRERVIAASGVIEDGSTHGKKGAPTYESVTGETREMPNLAEEYTRLGLEQLGLTDAQSSLRFFQRHPPEELAKLKVAVKLPAPPEYYSDHMDLSIVVDRGDVFYDPPFDENDKWRHQTRYRFPKLTLQVNYRGQVLPLVRWRTTIGGWRAEQGENGYEYYKYKGSDVGPRVMRKIISGPVWVAPESTPLRSMVASKKVEGRWQSMVNYDELGPGYLSAYGVVAGYFVIPGEGDNPDVDRGIRAHGSSNYLSIYSNAGYSHGCHRLPNHLAVRLYDFMLRHRNMKVHGDAGMDFKRQFLWKDHVYEMRIPSRGYEYELDPPVPIEVLKGRIRGTLQEPVEGYVEKPGVRYPKSLEEGDGAEGEDLLEAAAEGDTDAVTGASQRAAMQRQLRQRREEATP